MLENKCSCGQNAAASSALSSSGRDTVCIDTYRVLDSCRDRDCYEDVRVYLDTFGQNVINNANAVRIKDSCILWTNVLLDSIPFNRGFYQVTVRFFIKVVLEACIGIGGSQEFCGIAVVEKKVVLYGSEGNVSIFKSSQNTGFCDIGPCGSVSNNLPVGVVEVVAPIALYARIVDCGCGGCGGYCCCRACDIPESITTGVIGAPIDDDCDNKRLYVTLGIFSVIRIERPAQYLITASDYSVPEKECCVSDDGDPCNIFRNMEFPINEFSPASRRELREGDNNCFAKNNKCC